MFFKYLILDLEVRIFPEDTISHDTVNILLSGSAAKIIIFLQVMDHIFSILIWIA